MLLLSLFSTSLPPLLIYIVRSPASPGGHKTTNWRSFFRSFRQQARRAQRAGASRGRSKSHRREFERNRATDFRFGDTCPQVHIFDATSCKLIAASPLPLSYLSMTQKTTKSPTATFYTYVNTTKKKRGLLAHTHVVEANKQKTLDQRSRRNGSFKKKSECATGRNNVDFPISQSTKVGYAVALLFDSHCCGSKPSTAGPYAVARPFTTGGVPKKEKRVPLRSSSHT